jgi:hypothetical protein
MVMFDVALRLNSDTHEHVSLNCCKLRFTYLAESKCIFTWALLAGPLAKFQ